MAEATNQPPLSPPGETARRGPVTPLQRQVCLACTRDWRADDSTVFCAACRWVDSRIAATGGSEHFLPHIQTTRLAEQPQDVLACALHRLHFPRDTGFYGVYTTMSGALRRAGAERFEAACAQAVAVDSDLLEWAQALRPTHTGSLVALTELAAQVCPPALRWLASREAALLAACAERDAAATPQHSDYDRITFARALR